MTVIAYRDGVLASDSGQFIDYVFRGTVQKVRRHPDGALSAGCGKGPSCQAFGQWCEDGRPSGAKPELDEAFSGLLIEPDGAVKQYDHRLNCTLTEAEFHAFGVGQELALGAMAAGADAERAVTIAIELAEGCHGPVQSVRLG